jgi:hypothetical protein
MLPHNDSSSYRGVLDIYYGFTAGNMQQLPKQMGVATFQAWHTEIMTLIKDLQPYGVKYHGSVGHSDILEAYSQAGFLLYPTIYPETGCITMMKAMACGAIPLTSRYTESVLQELTTVPKMRSRGERGGGGRGGRGGGEGREGGGRGGGERGDRGERGERRGGRGQGGGLEEGEDDLSRDIDDFDMGPRIALNPTISGDNVLFTNWVRYV